MWHSVRNTGCLRRAKGMRVHVDAAPANSSHPGPGQYVRPLAGKQSLVGSSCNSKYSRLKLLFHGAFKLLSLCKLQDAGLAPRTRARISRMDRPTPLRT
jgi:hypothetical protein